MLIHLSDCFPTDTVDNNEAMNNSNTNNSNTNSSNNSHIPLECTTWYMRMYSGEYYLPPRM